MQKILTITAQISATASKLISNTLTANDAQTISAISMYMYPNPTVGGVVPPLTDIQLLERLVKVRLSRDPQQQQLFTKNFVGVAAFQSKELGFVPIEPFTMANLEQFTIQWDVVSNNVFAHSAFGAGVSAGIYLDVILWGGDGRNA